MSERLAERLTNTMRPAITPLVMRMMASMKRSLSPSMAKRASSIKNGVERAAAKGHPTTAPTANQKIPCAVFRPPRQFIKDEAPNMAMYMAKLEGR